MSNFAYDSIAISGVPGAGKSTFIDTFDERLREEYGVEWPIRSVGDEFRAQYAALEAEGKDLPPLREWWSNLPLKEQHAINDEFLEKVRGNEIRIADSRYVHIYNEDPDCNTLTLFLYAPLDVRAERSFRDDDREEGETLEDVKRSLHQREQKEAEIGKDLWEDDWKGKHDESYDHRNRVHYDLALNTATLSPEQEVDIVIAALTD